VGQCLAIKALPLLVFDTPEMSHGIMSKENIAARRRQIKEKYPLVSTVQMTSSSDYADTLQAYHDGVRAVFTKPSAKTRRATFIEDAIRFLETFTAYIKDFFREQDDRGTNDTQLGRLKDRILSLRNIQSPPEVSLTLLQSVAEFFERAITFVVRPAELFGEKAIGVYSEKDKGPSPASPLKIPLSEASIFRNVVETEKFYYGETDDALLREHLHAYIGAPLRPTVLILPMKVRGKIMTLTYADFGMKEVSPVESDALAIFSNLAGLIVENILYRKLLNKTTQK
jgi:hypothetical protein